LALLALGWAVISWLVPPPRNTPFTVFIRNAAGSPRTNVAIFGPDGDKRFPDSSGLVAVPGCWDKSIVSVRDQGTWAELTSVKLVRIESDTVTITIP
jgi:hypothetical protein